MATVKAALEPAGPPLPPAVPGQVQRLQQPTAPCPRRRMATGKPRVLGSLVGPWVAGWTSCSRSALPAQGRRRGGKLRCRPSGLTMVGTKPLCAFYTSLPCRCESCVCKAMAAASQGRARTRAGTLGPGWGLSDPGGLAVLLWLALQAACLSLHEYFREKCLFPCIVWEMHASSGRDSNCHSCHYNACANS